MSVAFVVVIILVGIVAAAAVCWLAVEIAVGRVRKGKERDSESARRDGV